MVRSLIVAAAAAAIAMIAFAGANAAPTNMTLLGPAAAPQSGLVVKTHSRCHKHCWHDHHGHHRCRWVCQN